MQSTQNNCWYVKLVCKRYLFHVFCIRFVEYNNKRNVGNVDGDNKLFGKVQILSNHVDMAMPFIQ